MLPIFNIYSFILGKEELRKKTERNCLRQKLQFFDFRTVKKDKKKLFMVIFLIVATAIRRCKCDILVVLCDNFFSYFFFSCVVIAKIAKVYVFS